MIDSQMDALLRSFFSAIERHDMETLQRIYAPSATVWHSYDDAYQSRADNLLVLDGFPTRFRSYQYSDIRRRFFEGGCVQQHALKGIANDGKPFSLLACMIIYMANEQISGIEEYFDTAQVPAA